MGQEIDPRGRTVSDLDRLIILAREGDADVLPHLMHAASRAGRIGNVNADDVDVRNRLWARALIELGFEYQWYCAAPNNLAEDARTAVSINARPAVSITQLCAGWGIPFFNQYACVSIHFPAPGLEARCIWTEMKQRLWLCDCFEAQVRLYSGFDPYTAASTDLGESADSLTASCLDVLKTIDRLVVSPTNLMAIAREYARKGEGWTREGQQQHNNHNLHPAARVVGMLLAEPSNARGEDVSQAMLRKSNTINTMLEALHGHRDTLHDSCHPGGHLRGHAYYMGRTAVSAGIIDTFGKIMAEYLLDART